MRHDATPLPPAAISRVIEALRRGEPWRRELEAVAVSFEAEDALKSIANEACGNWVWLTSFARRDTALDIGGAVSSMAPALSRHFRIVHHLEASPLLAEFAARRFAQDGLDNVTVSRGSAERLPFGNDSFDCVTLHGALRGGERRGSLQAALSECRRVLRPDGRVYLAFPNPLWYGRAAGIRRWRDGGRAVVPSVRAIGFRELERFYAFPAFDRPRVIVPATRRASYARETIEAGGTIRGVVRRATALAGLYAVLAPSVMIVARK